ncbi:MAG: hypothetical protein AB7G23_02945 [Vicinamibacterales bacterium]
MSRFGSPCRDCGQPADGAGAVVVGEWAYCPPCGDWRQDRDYLFDMRTRAALELAWLDIVADYERTPPRQRRAVILASARPLTLPFGEP